jgi:hypothetical protein
MKKRREIKGQKDEFEENNIHKKSKLLNIT